MIKKRLFLFLFVFIFCAVICSAQNTEIQPANTDDIAGLKGFGVSVAINQPVYWTDFMPPGWRPPVISMALKVFNYSQIPVTFHFRSSQRYDFIIYNSKGREVWRWSADKAFLDVLGELTLNPGESVTYTARIKFVNSGNSIKSDDVAGGAMPEDLYTLKGVLTAYDPELYIPVIMEGQVSFRHTYVY
ncbi:MAG: hypothetical protein JXB88_08395 [Spirochaetales bacterium]|nr:hypothetical protein [Spirochaetales bacterium]